LRRASGTEPTARILANATSLCDYPTRIERTTGGTNEIERMSPSRFKRRITIGSPMERYQQR